jgi:23S rRNA pseudouridine2605 synthase
MSDAVRLQRFLARAGVASRRHAEELIAEGRVGVNGAVVREMGTRVDPGTDVVTVDGRRVVAAAIRWLLLNKPAGYVCTRSDPQRRATVYELLPPDSGSLFTVGRLDVDTEGLLLFTNDGRTANRLMHPRYGVLRVYEARVAGSLTPEALAALEAGVPLDDGVARASGVRILRHGAGRTSLRLGLREGRKREVRRMLAELGHPVLRLRRVRFGPIRLGRLPKGACRELTDAEHRALARGTDAAGRTTNEKEA